MKYIMFYEMSPYGLEKVQDHFQAHRSRLTEFHKNGTLLMAGPYGSPPQGALGVFTSREAAQEFISGDPFVINGIVGKYTIHEWTEVLAQ